MRRLVIQMGASLALALLGACDRSVETDDTANLAEIANDAAPLDTASKAAPTDGAGYVAAAALGDMYEIESSKLAQAKAQSADVKRFAAQMIEDHAASTRQVTDAAAKAKLAVTLPTTLDPPRQAMVDALEVAGGAAFDTLYREQQLKAHEEALTLHQNYAVLGDSADLKVAASMISPKVQSHLDMLRAIQP